MGNTLGVIRKEQNKGILGAHPSINDYEIGDVVEYSWSGGWICYYLVIGINITDYGFDLVCEEITTKLNDRDEIYVGGRHVFSSNNIYGLPNKTNIDSVILKLGLVRNTYIAKCEFYDYYDLYIPDTILQEEEITTFLTTENNSILFGTDSTEDFDKAELQIYEAFNSQSELYKCKLSQYFQIGDYVTFIWGFRKFGQIIGYDEKSGTYTVKTRDNLYKQEIKLLGYAMDKTTWYIITNSGGGNLYSDRRNYVNDDFIDVCLDTGKEIIVYNNKKSEYKDLIKRLQGKYQTADEYSLFKDAIRAAYFKRKKVTEPQIRKIADNLGLKYNYQLMSQLIERTIVEICQTIIQSDSAKSDIQIFEELKDLYNWQPVIKPRDGKSKMLQQYSTPCPIAYLLGRYVGHGLTLEPTAGNGMLLIASRNNECDVNELDEIRYNNLLTGSYRHVTNQDANKLDVPDKQYDCVITNPPFMRLDNSKDYLVRTGLKGDREIKYTFKNLDYKLAVLALEKMKDSGRCAIIVGGNLGSRKYDHETNTYWDQNGKLRGGEWMSFLNYLNRQYNLEDVIYINGDLYQKQGTSFPIIALLVNGRRPQFDSNPLSLWRNDYDPILDAQVDTFDELYKRIWNNIHRK